MAEVQSIVVGTDPEATTTVRVQVVDQGERGDAATVDVGPVTVLDPDEPPYAQNAGDLHDAVIELGLPRAATLSFGQVTTLPPGEPATAVDVGVDGDVVLDIGIPEGQPGVPVELRVTDTHVQWRYVGDSSWTDLIALSELEGPQGPAWDGRAEDWDAGVTYDVADVVVWQPQDRDGPVGYISLQGGNVGNTPPDVGDAPSAWWQVAWLSGQDGQGSVDSVNGQTGHVTLDAADVGADPAGSAAGVASDLSDHVTDTDNPHGVTAVQVGADPAGSAAAVADDLDSHTQSPAHLPDATGQPDDRWLRIENGVWVITDPPEGGVGDHQDLTGRDRLDVHPALRNEYLSMLAETNVRVFQIEAASVGAVEGFTGWQGEAFLHGQDEVASVTGDLWVTRTGRLTQGGVRIGFDPLEGVSPGDPFMGGFYVGIIDTTVPGSIIAEDEYQQGLRYALIISPGSMESGTLAWRTSQALVPVTHTRWNGLAAQEAALFGSGTFPAFEHCAGQVAPIDDASPWYLPALDELELLYRVFKPTTGNNNTGTNSSDFPSSDFAWANGENPSSWPPGDAYTSGSPARTDVTAFRDGGAHAIRTHLWSATGASSSRAWRQDRTSGLQSTLSQNFSTSYAARPVRRLVLSN